MRQHVKPTDQVEEREVPLTREELEALIGDRDYQEFLNARNELFRERNMKQNPPTRAEALKLLTEHANLLKRPILVVGGKLTLGFDEKVWKEMLR